MQWIKGIPSLKAINGPTLYTAIASAVVLIAVNGLGWHLNTTTIMSFIAIVGGFIWNNGKFGFKAVHKDNFWITVIAGVLLILNQGLGWHFNTTYVMGFAASVIAVIFHISSATAAKMLQSATGSLTTSTKGG